jgi:methylase of polypeptide subunit release factors
MQIDAARYLQLAAAPERLRETLDIHVTEHAFLPSIDEILGDWVATIATPAFKLIRERQGAQSAFCSIGTGVGLDALAAIETLDATRIGVTDVHEDVVAAAVANIRRNLKDPDGIVLEAGSGDLLEPLHPGRSRYDLLYENLPNIPVGEGEEAASARKSSSLVPPRRESIPDSMRRNLLALHYVALRKAKEFLAPDGAVLSLIGARVPLDVFREMGRLTGYRCEIFTYGWKLQTDVEEIVRRYVRLQEEGFGPYRFYRVDRLAAVFANVRLEDSGEKAREIERSLAPDELSPADALAAWKQGERIGHTVVALRSVPD